MVPDINLWGINMLLKLRTKLILFIIGGALINIFLVSTLTNMSVFREYDEYMANEQGHRVQHLIIMIEQSYRSNNGWTKNTIENIDFSPYIGDFDMTILDTAGKTVFAEEMNSTMLRNQHERMHRIGRNRWMNIWNDMWNKHDHMTEESLRGEEYMVHEYSLYVYGEKVGTLKLGHIGAFTVYERDITFTRGIIRSIIYSALLSILVALAIGIYISKKFTRPIVEMTEAANNIRLGKLDTRVNDVGDTLELQQLSYSINHLSESLNEQNKLRKRLTSDISHELRTPLTILQSHIEAIIDGIWEPTEEKLNICKNEVSRLIKLVEELKHLNHIDSHELKLNIEKYNLSIDIKEIIEGIELQFSEKKVQLNKKIEEDIYIEADKDKVKQILINVLTNALKYTPSLGRVNVNLTEQKDYAVIEIKDTGIGIDSEDLPYVFERLYRSDVSRNRKTGGSGIGLSIVKTLVEAHGGDVSIISEKEKGTLVKILIPRKRTISG